MGGGFGFPGAQARVRFASFFAVAENPRPPSGDVSIPDLIGLQPTVRDHHTDRSLISPGRTRTYVQAVDPGRPDSPGAGLSNAPTWQLVVQNPASAEIGGMGNLRFQQRAFVQFSPIAQSDSKVTTRTSRSKPQSCACLVDLGHSAKDAHKRALHEPAS